MALLRNAPAKPNRGDYALERRGKKRERKLAEERVMRLAKHRDGNKCRFPRCEFKELRVEVAHLEHRGMGGNPSLDRTQLPKLIALCIRHHDQFDGRTVPDIAIVPISPDEGTNGPCAYYVRGESGQMEHVATERVIGISSTRNA